MASPQVSQISNLPQLQTLITSHNADGKAIIHSAREFPWQSIDEDKMAFSVVYSTSSFPPDLNNEVDINTHDTLMTKGVGLVNPGGTIIRCVDFAPGDRCEMHRTQSLDYGIILEGSVDMLLDSGERQSMKRGDVAVQRATMHQWINTSETEWARIMFVLQDCRPLIVAGKSLGEDLGGLDVPPSGN
jgi:uncharacterized cupin superfamily protein